MNQFEKALYKKISFDNDISNIIKSVLYKNIMCLNTILTIKVINNLSQRKDNMDWLKNKIFTK